MKVSRSARKTLRTGVRWKKGQSSSSNPRCRRFRDAATAAVGVSPRQVVGFGGGVAGVTKAALDRHNRRLEQRDSESGSSRRDEDEASEGQGSEAASAETWATNFTGCSNKCFDKVLAHWANKQNSEARKGAIAVLAAVAQMIRERGGRETNEEYFQALLTALVNVEPEMRPAAAHLLSQLLRRMEPAAIAPAFAPLSRACLQLLFSQQPQAASSSAVKDAKSDDAQLPGRDDGGEPPAAGLQRNLLLCLGSALASLPKTAWHAAATRQVLQATLQFTQSDRPRLRKAALRAIDDVLSATEASVPVALTTAFALDRLRRGSGVVSPTLRLLLAAAPHQAEKQVKATVEVLLTSAPAAATAAGATSAATFAESLRVIRALLWRRLTPQLTGQILSALYDARPPLEDAESARAWLETARAGVSALAPMDTDDQDGASASADSSHSEILEAHLAKLFNTAFGGLAQSGLPDRARRACADTCHHLMVEVLPRLRADNGALRAARDRALSALEGGLASYEFYASWHHVTRLLGAFFRCHGLDCLAEGDGGSGLKRCLRLLASLRDSADDKDSAGLCACLESALAAALESLGPSAFLTVVPADDASMSDAGGWRRSWLLPLLKRHVPRGAELAAFGKHLLPLADRCHRPPAAAGGGGGPSPAAKIIELQVWSTLPAFCSGPADFAQSVPLMARRLGEMLASRPDLRLHLLAALRRLVTSSASVGIAGQDGGGGESPAGQRALMSGYAKNFLPRLFALHSDPTALRSHRLAALETVRRYAPVAPPALLTAWFAKAAAEGAESPAANAAFASSADLVVAMAPCLLDASPVVDLCARWCRAGSSTEKKGYRLAESVLAAARRRCESHSAGAETPGPDAAPAEAALRRLATVVLDAAAAGPAAPSSRKSRMRCLALCVATGDRWLEGSEARERLAEMALPEAVLGSREINSQAREAADSLLLEVFKFYTARHMQRHQKRHQHQHHQQQASDIEELDLETSAAADSDNDHAVASSAAVGFLSAVFAAAGSDPETVQAALYSVTGLLTHLRHCMSRDLLASLLSRLAGTMEAPDSPRTLVKAALRCLASVVRKFGHEFTLEQVADCLQRLPETLRPVFRATIRRILTDLLAAYPYDALRSGLPQFYHKQLANVRKRTEYKARQGKRRGDGAGDKADDEDALTAPTRVVRGIDDLLRMSSDDEDDNEDEDDLGKSATKSQKNKKTTGKRKSAGHDAAWLEEGEDEILDLRDPQAAARIHRSRPAALSSSAGAKKRPAAGGSDEFKLAADGRMIILGDDEDDESDSDNNNGRTNAKKAKKRQNLLTSLAAMKLKKDNDDDDDADDAASLSSTASGDGKSARYQPGGRGIHRDMSKSAGSGGGHGNAAPPPVKKPKTKKKSNQQQQSDVAPYSYLTLDRRLLNRKNVGGKRARMEKYKSLLLAKKAAAGGGGGSGGRKAKRK